MRLRRFAGMRLLLVEDEFFIAEELRLAFVEAGANIIGPVACVEAALALVNGTEAIDVAVLDVRLLDGLVFPVADVLQARKVPFVFATGYERTLIPSRFAKILVFEKPVEPHMIARALFGG